MARVTAASPAWPRSAALALAAVVAAAPACGSEPAPADGPAAVGADDRPPAAEPPPTGTPHPEILGRYRLADPGPGLALPGVLREVSGLALHDGLLLAHADEEAVLYALDPETGETTRRIRVGPGGVAGDWEGVASDGRRLYLVESGGDLLAFGLDGDPQEDAARRFVTDAGETCEIEGLDHDPDRGLLLLACKTPYPESLRDDLVILGLRLDPLELLPEPVLRISEDELDDAGLDDGVHPSAVALDAATGALLILAAREGLIFTVLPDGAIGEVVRLDRRRMPQAEGLALAPDGTLYVATEGRGGAGRLFVLRPVDAPEASDPGRERAR